MNSLKNLKKQLAKLEISELEIDLREGSLFLNGKATSWEKRVHAGHKAGKLAKKMNLYGVHNCITVPGCPEESLKKHPIQDKKFNNKSFDVLIIGGGVTGCGIARELSAYDIKVGLVEKEADFAMGASSRNDGMVHPGFAAPPGSLKASYNTRGNRLYTQWSKELGFTLERPGSLLLYHSWWMHLLTPIFKLRCQKNGVDGDYRGLSQKEVKRMEPHATPKQRGGFFMPSAGIVSPYKVVLALAENGAQNGVSYLRECQVEGFIKDKTDNSIKEILTNRGALKAKLVINAAGIWADKIAFMAGDHSFSLHGRKGTDAILDKKVKPLQKYIMGMPHILGHGSSHSKGGGLVPCIEGNILIGPTAKEVPNREDFSTEPEIFKELMEQLKANPSLKKGDIITYYSGIRAASWTEDFIIRPSHIVNNLLLVAGIQSPGLASAPAIAKDVSQMAVNYLKGLEKKKESQDKPKKIRKKEDYNPIRSPRPHLADLSLKEREEIIKKDPAYGEIICRCEEVSKGEIRDALKGEVGATTLDGLKRRTRVGAGRCHGGFCLPKTLNIMAETLDCSLEDLNKKGQDSWIVKEETKEKNREAL